MVHEVYQLCYSLFVREVSPQYGGDHASNLDLLSMVDSALRKARNHE